MIKMNKILIKIKRIIYCPGKLLYNLIYRIPFFKKMSDEKYIKLVYRIIFGKKLNLENPKTYSEKLQWLKLYDRKKIYTTMVDKYEAKKYVANIIGDEYIIPTLGIYNSFDEIDFSKLPNQFVIKCTHDSGGLVVVKDKNKINIKKVKKIINKCLNNNFYYIGREWPYKNVKPRIIVEKYMCDNKTNELRDYKFFCFDGNPKLMFLATDRNIGQTKFNFYDLNFNLLPFKQGHPNDYQKIDKPITFNQMIELSKKLSKDIPHVRVDFYEINGRVYFGELTLFHFSGFEKFIPSEWDEKLGNMINLDK